MEMMQLMTFSGISPDFYSDAEKKLEPLF